MLTAWEAPYGVLLTDTSVVMLCIASILGWWFIHCLIPTLALEGELRVGSFVRIANKLDRSLHGQHAWCRSWNDEEEKWKVQLQDETFHMAGTDELTEVPIAPHLESAGRSGCKRTCSGRVREDLAIDVSVSMVPRPSNVSVSSVSTRPSFLRSEERAHETMTSSASFSHLRSVAAAARRAVSWKSGASAEDEDEEGTEEASGGSRQTGTSSSNNNNNNNSSSNVRSCSKSSNKSGNSMGPENSATNLVETTLPCLERPSALDSEAGHLDRLRTYRRKAYREIFYLAVASSGSAAVLVQSWSSPPEPFDFDHLLASHGWRQQLMLTILLGHWTTALWEEWVTKKFLVLSLLKPKSALWGAQCSGEEVAVFIWNALRLLIRIGLVLFSLTTRLASSSVLLLAYSDLPHLLLARRSLGFSESIPPRWMCDIVRVKRHWLLTYVFWWSTRGLFLLVLLYHIIVMQTDQWTCRLCSPWSIPEIAAFAALIVLFAMTSIQDMVQLCNIHRADLLWATALASNPILAIRWKPVEPGTKSPEAEGSWGPSLRKISTFSSRSRGKSECGEISSEYCCSAGEKGSPPLCASPTSDTSTTSPKVCGRARSERRVSDSSVESDFEVSESSCISSQQADLRRFSKSSRNSLTTLLEEDPAAADPDFSDACQASEATLPHVRTLGVAGRPGNDPKHQVFFRIVESE